MTTTDTRRLQEAEMNNTMKDAEIRRLIEENETLRAQIAQQTTTTEEN